MVVAGTLIAAGVPLFIFVYSEMSSLLEKEVTRRSVAVAQDLNSRSVDLIMTDDLFALSNMINKAHAENPDFKYIFVADVNHRPIAHTFEAGIPNGLLSANPADPAQPYSLQLMQTQGEVFTDIALPIFGARLGELHLGLSYDNMRRTLGALALRIALVIGFVIFVISAIIIILMSFFIKPLSFIIKAAQEVGRGNLGYKIARHTNDEIGQVSLAFNQMIEQLYTTTVSKSELEEEVKIRKLLEEEARRNYNIQSTLNAFLNFSLEDIPLNELFDKTLNLLLSVTLFTFESKGAIFLADGDALVMKTSRALAPPLMKHCAIVPFGRCLCGKAALTKKLQFVNHLDERHEISYDGIKQHGHYCVPILSGEKLLGVINMYIRANEPFNPKAQEFLLAVGSILAGAIERRKAEDALKESEANLILAQRIAQLGSWEWNARDDAFFWSPEARRLFGLEPDKMPKRFADLLGIVHPEDREGLAKLHEENIKGLKDKGVFACEYRIVCGEGTERFLRVEGRAILDREGNISKLVGTIQDISRQKELEKTQRLVQLGILVAHVAHEVNNPLMVVSGRAQLALMEEILNDEVKNNLGIIVHECQRAKEIINRLLIFSKPSKSEAKYEDINAIIDEIVLIVEHQFSLEDITITRHYGHDFPKLLINSKEIQEVIINLLNNAHDAVKEKGAIEISTYREGDFLRIDIKDSGIGMSEEVAGRIFDPFFSTKPMGTGLGLSVCYSIVQAHGGELTYASAPGKGTTATIQLPIKIE